MACGWKWNGADATRSGWQGFRHARGERVSRFLCGGDQASILLRRGNRARLSGAGPGAGQALTCGAGFASCTQAGEQVLASVFGCLVGEECLHVESPVGQHFACNTVSVGVCAAGTMADEARRGEISWLRWKSFKGRWAAGDWRMRAWLPAAARPGRQRRGRSVRVRAVSTVGERERKTETQRRAGGRCCDSRRSTNSHASRAERRPAAC